jgi:hypothetical protein
MAKAFVAEVPADALNSWEWLQGQQIDGYDAPLFANDRTGVLAPAARRRPKVDDDITRTQQPILLLQLIQLEHGPGSQALGLGTPDKRISRLPLFPTTAGGTLRHEPQY